MAFKQPPLTPIPSDVQKTNPELYQYLMRLQGVVLGIVGGVNDAQKSSTNVETSVTSSLSGKADKVFGATAGDVATLDAQGNLTDSGALLTATPTPGAAPLADLSGKLNDWVDMPSVEGFFEFDESGALMPVTSPTTSDVWELDENGDIQPKAAI